MQATGDAPLRLQWRFAGAIINGATNASLVVSNLQSSGAGQYGIVVSNAFGVVTNLVFTLNVAGSPPVILSQPQGQLFLPGANLTLTIGKLGSEPMTYQWSKDGLPLGGATNASLALLNLQSNSAGAYQVAISNGFGFTNSASAMLTVGDPYPGQVDWPSFSFSLVVTNTFLQPTHIANAGDGSGRLFVVRKAGLISIVQNGAVLSNAFLNITNRVLTGTERGLFCVAFPPGYSTNPHCYVNYTRKPDGATVVSRFFLTADPNVADTNSEQVVLVVPQPYANHNGGQLAFGPDGHLYIGMGDGGYPATTGDPLTNAQNRVSLLGKLLRIDVENGATPYAVPTNNPFVSDTNFAPEIWALGLRNPWRFSFDRTTGGLYIADVGHSRYEEIDFQPPGSAGGQNYGWRIREGPVSYISVAGFDLSTLTGPVAWYGRTEGLSVSGGFVYHGPNEPRMNGSYFFGDFSSGRIWGLRQAGTNWVRFETVDTVYGISTFGEDESGQLYLANYNDGRIYRIEDSGQAILPTLTPSGGAFTVEQSVIASTATPGALIHYTTDGRDPTEFDPSVPSGSTIPVNSSLILKVRAFRADLTVSLVKQGTFTLNAAAPTFLPTSGPITNGTSVAIASATPGATIRYTLDGNTPSPASPLYTGFLVISGNTTLKAKAYKSGFAESGITSVFFEWAQVASPSFTPTFGPITNATPIAISTPTPGAMIHYTLDGTDPTSASPLYASPILVNGNTTLKAFATGSGYIDSQIASTFYTLVEYERTVVTTLAGHRDVGWADGFGKLARFSSPQGVCVDSSNNLFVADSGNHVIRKVSPSGLVTTIAGAGIPGSQDGLGTNALFNSPSGVAVDSAGNVFVADRNNGNRLRKISSSGQVTTVAMLRGEFAVPSIWQVELDTNGVAHVGSWLAVIKVLPDGTVLESLDNSFSCYPYPSRLIGVGLDHFGNIFAAVADCRHVRKIAPNGTMETYAGAGYGFSDGPRLSALFSLPLDTTVDFDESVFVSDQTRVRKIGTNGLVSTYAGAGPAGYVDGRSSLAQFSGASGLCVDTQGTVYVADTDNHCIRKIWVDSDGDGIPDLLEGGTTPYVLGVDDRFVDADGDGQSNTAEFWAATDPRDPNSLLGVRTVVTESSGQVTISWLSQAGISYQAQYSSDLQTWTNLGSAVIGTGLSILATDTQVPVGTEKRFYRVVLSDL